MKTSVWTQWGLMGVLALGCTVVTAAPTEQTAAAKEPQSEEKRAEDAVDELTEEEENTEMRCRDRATTVRICCSTRRKTNAKPRP